jgi:hypothetical protein
LPVKRLWGKINAYKRYFVLVAYSVAITLPRVIDTKIGDIAAPSGAAKAHSEDVNAHCGAVKDHSGAIKAHLGDVNAHCGAENPILEP